MARLERQCGSGIPSKKGMSRRFVLHSSSRAVPAIGVPKENVAHLRKTCYGFVQAPYEWYETVRAYFLSLGFQQCLSDPCCWLLVVEGIHFWTCG